MAAGGKRVNRTVGRVIVAASVLVLAAAAAVPAMASTPVPAFASIGGTVRLVAPDGAQAPFPAARIVRLLRGGGVAIDVPSARAAEAYADLVRRYGAGSTRPDGVARIAADHIPSDPLWSEMWGARRIGAPAAWGVSLGSPDVVIAVLDSGVNEKADLAGAVLPGTDIVNGGSDTSDSVGHGTFVAEVAAGRIDNGSGGAGICPRCSVLPVKVMRGSGPGWTTDIDAGIYWAVDHGATVINLSLAGKNGAGEDDAAVRYARSAGVSVVAGAGNEGDSEREYPAAAPGVLSVAWTDQVDALDPDSSFGSWVDLAAPGEAAVVSADGKQWRVGGTSFSAPVVAGALALMASAAPSSTMAEREEALRSTAAAVVPADAIGGGRIDVSRALAALGTEVVPPAQPVPGAPVITVTAPTRGVTYTRATTIDVTWDETTAPGATIASRTVTREATPVAGGVCDDSTWAPTGDPIVTDATHQTSGTLSDGTCYRWRIDVVDTSGNAASATTHVVFADRRKPVIRPVLPKKLTRISATRIVFRWAVDDGTGGSGVAKPTRVVTQSGRVSGSTCTGWRTWGTGTVPPGIAEYPFTVVGPICVRLRLTVTDAAGNTTTTTLPAYLHR